jgi:hypothetical protein
MFGNNMFNSNGAYPIFFNLESHNDESKLSHDSYSVYVNGQLVGNKTLVTPTEKASDVEGYLKDRGYHNFNANVTGNEILINTAYDESEEIKRNLGVYLNLR